MSMRFNLSPEAQYEIAQARAGNVLFCSALVSNPATLGCCLVPFSQESRRLLRLLLKGGVHSRHDDADDDILQIGFGLQAAIAYSVGHTQCAEYLLYRLEGIPDANEDARRVARLRAIIGTFYANLLAARTIGANR